MGGATHVRCAGMSVGEAALLCHEVGWQAERSSPSPCYESDNDGI